jgi:hypothetical protein
MTARRTAFGPVALLLTAGACAPAVLWSRHTGDRLTAVEARRRGALTWLAVIDRDRRTLRESPRFDEIAFEDAVFADGGRHFAVAARQGDRWQVLRDLTPGPAWAGVAAMTFDRGGERLAYAAQDGGRWRVVADKVVGAAHDAIGEPIAFSDDGARVGYVAVDAKPDRCARVVVAGAAGGCWRGVTALAVGCSAATDTYVAVDGAARVVVRGGAPVGRFEDVRELHGARCGQRWAAIVRTLEGQHALVDGVTSAPAREVAPPTFAPGGRRLAYAVQRDGWAMNVDGVDGERFESIGPPVFSADGNHVGYLGERQGQRWLVIDGATRAAAPSAFGLTLGPDGRRFAYVTGSAANPGVVCDGVAYPFPMVVEDTVSFSRDGRHWGVLAGNPAERRLFIAVDGRPARRLDTTELFGSVGVGARGGVPALLRRWVAAEMEIALGEGDRR